jgi:hypothetical protein
MRRVVLENATCALLALAGSVSVAWLGLQEIAWGGDYEQEARPAFEALAHGHLLSFLQRVPAYGGSLVERAPFALVPGLWGGGEQWVFRLVAVPALIAGAALGIWLVARLRSKQRSALIKLAALSLCVLNPLTLRAIEFGHPEELLGAVLCVWAVLLAQRGRAVSAGIVLGLAIANKEWALLAVGPALLALPSRRMLMMLCSGVAAALVLAPLALVGGGGFVAGARASALPGATIFQPMQVFWFFGHHSAQAAHLLGAAKREYRLAPSWVSAISHPLVIAVAVPLTALAFGRRRRENHGPNGRATGSGGRANPMLLLALLLLLRCMLDTWDNVYYPLPLVIALLVWETCTLGRAPVLALIATALVWLIAWPSLDLSVDLQSALFLAWSVPLAISLGVMLYLPGARARWRLPRRDGSRELDRALAVPRAAR